eukprot:TRINITY_DN11846_c0_g1_i1.p2 TRINITY_DN11846_c0_g1~~TRINITY_DN11846_c0_g1_i1.p2  ORF type:complete len:173 (-),score=46.39 TRINITY_DN11846_c0_g1_i1:20-538(-)
MTPVRDGEVFRTEGATLRAIHTPGHTADHVAFELPEDQAVLSGDCILGVGTAVFQDLHTYMLSLRKLSALSPAKIYSAHGPLVADASAKIHEYIKHREAREAQIVGLLKQRAEAALTSMEIVQAIYADVPVHLHRAAEGNVLLHLGKLEKDSAVVRTGGDTEPRWRAAGSRL